MRDGESPEIVVLDSDCLMAKEEFGTVVATAEILAGRDSLDPAVNDGACARELVICFPPLPENTARTLARAIVSHRLFD
ncbi:MAG: hypothetical protein PHR85_01015 [Malikia sp.]|nr:hypothetical protein [Malikia sp.]